MIALSLLRMCHQMLQTLMIPDPLIPDVKDTLTVCTSDATCNVKNCFSQAKRNIRASTQGEFTIWSLCRSQVEDLFQNPWNMRAKGILGSPLFYIRKPMGKVSNPNSLRMAQHIRTWWFQLVIMAVKVWLSWNWVGWYFLLNLLLGQNDSWFQVSLNENPFSN